MTDKEKLEAWDAGFKAYWDKKEQSACPNYPESDLRDEWMGGWLTAQDADQREI